MKRVAFLQFFIEDNCILPSVLYPLWCDALFFLQLYEENIASHKHMVREGRNSLVAFPDNCGVLLFYYTKTQQVVIS